MHVKTAVLGGLLAASLTVNLAAAPAAAIDIAAQPDTQQFIDEMVSKHGFARTALLQLFAQVQYQPKIIAAITRPAEAKPWYEYRPIFLQDSRIQGGAQYWSEHAELLAQAEREYGVPPEIVVAIIGVETRYGKHAGTFRVMDALSTLAFDYPQRGKFFRSELENFLLLAREEKMDPLTLKGSYAGAMGHGQFIASSYRHYAVDFDKDGQRDLWNSYADVIGSVANYFARHGWRAGEPITAPASTHGEAYKPLANDALKPGHTVGELRASGVNTEAGLDDGLDATLLELEGKEAPEYWVGLHNFYVITRYNHSPLYAMAVYQLSQEIKALREHTLSAVPDAS